uniref:Uncharacterized protein n=1 Tax=Rhodococcus hoagii TaxID=43767 RepID=Q9ETH3_RHOHA|nr:unknown [Prescottella equi]ADI50245.1 hypothetical protein pVAPA_0560 [Prescottella equi]BAB16618.1 hypothetical protein [Prescottella equi]CAQ30403.1 hypothetical protein pVAPA_0560 [Prescottella equi]
MRSGLPRLWVHLVPRCSLAPSRALKRTGSEEVRIHMSSDGSSSTSSIFHRYLDLGSVPAVKIRRSFTPLRCMRNR